jgi:anti-sigma B factor antagonist
MSGDATGLVVRPSGDIDVATVAAFRASVQSALETEPPALVVDLSGVEFMDSSGLAVLAVALRGQRARSAAVAVVRPQPIVKRAIELVGLDLLFDVSDIPTELLEQSAR